MRTCRHGVLYSLNCKHCIVEAIGEGTSLLTMLKEKVEHLEQVEAAAKACAENPTYDNIEALRAELRDEQ